MDILNKLGIKDINFGGCSGPGNWTKGKMMDLQNHLTFKWSTDCLCI